MVKLQVTNMRCMSCVHNIQDEIKELDSAVEITANVKKGEIEVKSSLTNEALIEAVKKAGYDSIVVTD